MNREEFFYLLPYVFSLALSLGVFIYTWQHRYVRGARLYSWFMGGQILTILAFIFELVSPNLQTKLLWDKFQWLTDSFLVILPFLFFSVQFSEYKLHYPRLTWGGILTFPIIFAALVLTDNIHHLIYPNPHLSTDYPFPELQYKFTIIVYGYALIYLYIANLYGISLLIRRAVQPNNLYRRQYWTIIAGFLIPLILSTFAFANLRITPQRDITPFSLALGNLIVAWGLFRYRIFDIVPIAREQIVENIADPVVVLDATNRIVDINPAALRLLGRSSAETIGRVSNEAFARWPVLVSELEYLDVERKEITIQEDDDIFFYDLEISPMYNTNRQMIGRILVAHDITRHKTLESGYRILSEELEQRVKERTDELRHTAERYRAVVENQTEFIVRWKPDGTRTFVNEAYCRYWRLTFEEALAINFLAHIHEEDRQAVDEKISRLISGRLTAKTETHRVIKPDGSIAWHEWTDQVIRNEAGDLIEFQSVGRDVTEHKQAEKALRESEEKLRTLFNILPVGISVLDKDRQITEMNPRLQEILKIPSKELLEGKSQQRKYIKSDGTPISAEEFPSTRAFKEQKQVLNNELGILKDDGELIWVNVSAAPLPGFGVVVTTTDITERKRAEEALRESEAIYRQAIEVAGAVPYRQSYPGEEFHITYDFIGEGIRKITGYGPDEFYEELWDSMVQESHPAGELAQYSWREAVQRVRTGASPIWQCEHRIQTRNGETRWLYEAAVELRDKDGQSHGSIGLFQDVTERKQVEEALRTSEERFSKAFQASPIVITLSQINSGKLLEVNDAFERVMGYSRDEVIGKTATELQLWTNQVDRERIVQKILVNGKLKDEELQFQTKHHNIITCNYSAELIELDSEQCILAVVEDITERKEAELRILHLNRLYVTISQINQTIVHARNKESLFNDICHVAIKHGKFRMAWIGLIDNEKVEPKIFAGEELGYLENLVIEFRDKITGSGPTGTAIREGHCVICQDIATDPRMAFWREQALSRGYRSSAAVPIREQGQVIGALTVYASEPQGFNADDEELLEQIGQDVSFALDSIHADIKRKQAEAILLNQLAFDELMTNLLAKFATCSYAEVDASIEFALQTVAEFLGGDLADLFVLSKDKTSWNITHKWTAPHIQIQTLGNSKSIVVSGEQLAWTENQLLRGNPITIKTLDDYPPEAKSDRKFAEAQGVKSILTIPIKGQEQRVFGCIDIVSYSSQVSWSDNDVARLRLIGDAIANLLDRKRAEANLAEAYDTTLEGWAKALELRDKETEGHSRRVTETTLSVARAMNINEDELVHIRRGSILHDIGKMGIPDQILRKEGPLTDEERQVVLKHPDTAYNLLKQIPYLDKALEIPHCHHEKWDGTGYPRGLAGEDIPLSARIFAIVDVWDALASDRPYRKAWNKEDIIQYILKDSGKHFDPHVVDVFLAMVEKGEI